MKKSLLLTVAIMMVSTTSLVAQIYRSSQSAPQPSVNKIGNENTPAASSTSHFSVIESGKLSPFITVSGADQIPVSGIYFLQSNGRALHNIQVDPSNPSIIHAVLQQTTANTSNDTLGADFPSRRCFYTISSDAGKHWAPPVSFSSVKTGFPSLILVQHNGHYYPIIAAHRLATTGSTAILSALYLPQSDGTIVEAQANRNAAGGTLDNILWPSIAPSQHADSIFIIGDISKPSGSNPPFDFMQFGSFKLSWGANGPSGATFNGWTAQIGSSYGSYPAAGWSSGGDHVIHVSPGGKIGVEWLNQTQDRSTLTDGLYFTESLNGGKTWPSDGQPFVPQGGSISNARNSQDVPTTGEDFWYVGETPNFVWGSVASLPAGSTPASFYPTLATISFWDGLPSDTVRHVISRLYTDATDTAAFTIRDPSGSALDPQGHPVFDYVTAGRTSNPKIFSLFYEALAEGDSAAVTLNDGTLSEYLFSSIYRSSTTDGGLSWSGAIPVRTNVGATTPMDYRYPQVSEWNALLPKGPLVQSDYQTMIQADSLAGYLAANGLPSFGINYYFHQEVLDAPVNSVKPGSNLNFSLEQNFPNPVNPLTNLKFNLETRSDVVLTVEDILGRTVAILINDPLSPGPHTASFDASKLSAGVYRYTLTTEQGSVSKSMTVLR